ncbi:hypothetical protein ACLOJK_010615 [Asimina triloba]
MASSRLQIPILALVLCLCSNAMVSMAASAKDLDFYYLVLMWPGSFCQLKASDGCCFPTTGKPGVDFFVAGLLPYSNDGTALTQCNRSPFRISLLEDIEEELHNYWPSIKCPSSDGRRLWSNTWKTYGVCSGLSVHDYFKKALDLRNNIDLLTIFKKNGIVPSGTAYYSLSNALAAIENGIGTRAGIRCAKNAWDESMIYEIYVCVNRDATKIVHCPVLPESTCEETTVFGLFNYEMLSNKTNVAANPIRMRVQNL